MTPRFLHAVAHTLAWEGGFTHNPSDRGGDTRFGISAATFPHENIAQLTIDRAIQLYCVTFWMPLCLDELPPRIAAKVFDTAVNMGPTAATRLLQQAFNILAGAAQQLVEDGVMGAVTRGRANRFQSEDVLLAVYCGLQWERYRQIIETNPSQRTFLGGWARRASYQPEAGV